MPDFASPSFGGFAFIGSLAVLAQFSFRLMALRRRVFPVLFDSFMHSGFQIGFCKLLLRVINFSFSGINTSLLLRSSALQSIRIRCSPPRVTVAMASSSGIGCSFRVSGSPKYRSAWSGEPAVPSALASAVRVFLGELRWSHF
jgi:hypothetical protein